MIREQFVIEGNHKLQGSVTISGNKNAALKMLPACLLTDEPVVLHNVPDIADVRVTFDLMRSLGASVEVLDDHRVRVHAKDFTTTTLDRALTQQTRASIVFAGPMLARTGTIELYPPGGDVIGRRRLDTHVLALEKLGAAHVVNADRPGFSRRMAELCKAENPRVLLDAVTGPQGAAIFHAMGRGARWIVYGRLDASDTTIREPGQMIFMGKRIEGFWLIDWMRRASAEKRAAVVAEAQQRFADGKWKTDVTAIVPLKEAMRRVPEELAKPNGKVFIAP